VFDENNKPVSGEAYTLARFCHKIKISGEAGHFRDNSHILILLGDIVNGGECGYFDCYNSQAFKNLYSAVDPWLYTGNILYLAGNHDKNAKFYNTVAKFPRKSVVETIDCETRKEAVFSKHGVMFEHGHKFDCLCSGKTFLGLMGDFASDIVANLCTPDLEDLLRGRDFYYDHSKENGIKEVPKETTIKSLSYEDRKVANGALNLLSKHPDCHTIICGHTHQSPVRITVQNNGQSITYYNTGKFARDGYLNIRVKKGE
jgi:UDP-2,3-diacylglucosamine pyrophosphatase LpxH